MPGWIEMAAECVVPIARLGEVLGFAFFVAQVWSSAFRRSGPVVNRRVIAAVKIGVCFRIDMLGKKPAAITQSDANEAAAAGAPRAGAFPLLKPWFQPRNERECRGAQPKDGDHGISEAHIDDLS